MKPENVFYISHAIIVVAFITLIGVVVYLTNNYTYLWLLTAILVYQPWYKLNEKRPEKDSEKE